jgi:hypothetical protein
VVHEYTARLHAREDTVFTGADSTHVVVVTDAGEYDAGFAGCLGRRRRRAAGKLLQPLIGSGGGAVVHGHLMAGVRQMAGHVKSHNAQAYESHLLGIVIARISAHQSPPSPLDS